MTTRLHRTPRIVAIAGALTLGLLALSGCGGGDDKVLTPVTADITTPDIALPGGITVPDITLPGGGTLPDIQNEDEAIDFLLDQFEGAGVPMDRDCMEDLLKDEALRQQLQDAGEPTAEVIQLFIRCLRTGG